MSSLRWIQRAVSSACADSDEAAGGFDSKPSMQHDEARRPDGSRDLNLYRGDWLDRDPDFHRDDHGGVTSKSYSAAPAFGASGANRFAPHAFAHRLFRDLASLLLGKNLATVLFRLSTLRIADAHRFRQMRAGRRHLSAGHPFAACDPTSLGYVCM